MLTRKTFKMAAQAIKRAVDKNPAIDGRSANIRVGIQMVAAELAVEFKYDNPKFKIDKFMEACGL
jgi:hypothetical protein